MNSNRYHLALVIAGSAMLLLACAGCMSMAPLPGDGGGVKNGGVICSTFTGLAGVKAKVVQVTSDAGVVRNGAVRSTGDCETVEFTTTQQPKPPSPGAP